MLFFATIVLLARVCSYSDQDDAVAVFMPPSSSPLTPLMETLLSTLEYSGLETRFIAWSETLLPHTVRGEAVTNTNTGVAQMRRAPLHHGVIRRPAKLHGGTGA